MRRLQGVSATDSQQKEENDKTSVLAERTINRRFLLNHIVFLGPIKHDSSNSFSETFRACSNVVHEFQFFYLPEHHFWRRGAWS